MNRSQTFLLNRSRPRRCQTALVSENAGSCANDVKYSCSLHDQTNNFDHWSEPTAFDTHNCANVCKKKIKHNYSNESRHFNLSQSFSFYSSSSFHQSAPPRYVLRNYCKFLTNAAAACHIILLLFLVATTTSGFENTDNNKNNYYSVITNYNVGTMRVHRALPSTKNTFLPNKNKYNNNFSATQPKIDGGDSLTSWPKNNQPHQLLRDTTANAAQARSAIGACLDSESCVFSWVCDDIGKPVRFCSGPFFYFTVCCRGKDKQQPQPPQRHKKKKLMMVVPETTTAADVIMDLYQPLELLPVPESSMTPFTTTTSAAATTTTTLSSTSPTMTSSSDSPFSSINSLPTLINITILKPTRTTLPSTTLPSIITLQSASSSNFMSSTSTSSPSSSSSTVKAAGRRTCGQAPLVYRNPRIVGGGDTQYGALSYQAMVVIKGQERCGGALLDNQWVVTGGHCVAPTSVTADDMVVKLGEWDRSHDNELFPLAERRVKKFILHPNYGKERSFANDVALLKLDRPVEYQPHIQPACLPEQPDEDFTGLYGTVSGWGRLNFRENRPDILQFVEVPIMSNAQCESMFKKQETPEKIIGQMMCAGYDEGGRDACQGDSGGPMAIRKEGAWTLIGIVSWGYGCGLPGYPGVYTRIAKFSDWLVQTMWNDRE